MSDCSQAVGLGIIGGGRGLSDEDETFSQD